MQRLCQVSEVARGLEAPWTRATHAIFLTLYTLHFTPIKIENVAWSNVAKGSPGANNATWDRGTSSKQDPNQVAILRLMPMMTTEQEVFPQKVRTKVASVRRHMLASGYSSYKKAAWKAS